MKPNRVSGLMHFNPRPPRGERHFDSANALTVRKISIHALREESDRYASSQRTGSKMISIHALREESDLKTETAGLYILISIHALREESDRSRCHACASKLRISIHALREESDASRSWFWPSRVNFNPRPPRGERPRMTRSWKSTVYFNPRPPRGERQLPRRILFRGKLFQSTPSARRATFCVPRLNALRMISIHALREESDRSRCHACASKLRISIHALREESDASRSWFWPSRVNFNPRPPRGERPRMTRSWKSTVYFNPRPPRGERQLPRRILFRGKLFQSTPSARRATFCVPRLNALRMISIHALREESDAWWSSTRRAASKFQSTPSARRATARRRRVYVVQIISIHALREESDRFKQPPD